MANNKDFIVKNGLVVLAQGSSQSTSTTTGAIVTPGGIGIGGNVSVGGIANITGSLIVNGYDLRAFDQDVYFVSDSIGNDTYDGRTPQSPFATVKKALSVATTGTTVKIEAGTYTEIWPLTVPAGVTVKGAGLRSVLIQPTVGTKTNDGFLLNGECTLSDFTVANHIKPSWAFKFAPGAKITSRSPYVERVSVITKGSVTTAADPFGFASGDAGHGALLDASTLNSSSLEPAMLWNEVTMIVPNAIGFKLTQGARAEVLNCFTYFADIGIQAEAGTSGFGGSGRTKLRLGGITGTFTAGDYLNYYSSTGTLIVQHQISSVEGDYLYFNYPAYGFKTTTDVSTSTQVVFSTGTNAATATSILLADYHQFGAELRSIGSACVYGTSGVVADGTGTDMKLIAFNFSHIGSGGDLSNDTSLTVQGNEVAQVNGGKVFYQSVDQEGNFRVGGSFLVNQRTGDVNFGNANIALNTLTSVFVSDGVNTAGIEPTRITVGSLTFSGNNITNSSGNLTIASAGAGNVIINDNTIVQGTFTATGVLRVTNTSNAVSITTGAIQSSGGIAAARDVWVGGNLNVQNTATVNQLIINEQIAILTASNLTALSATITTATITSALIVTNSTNASSTTTGAVVISGGAGIGRNLFVGGDAYLQGNLYVDGTQFTINSTNLLISDKTVTVSSTASSAIIAQDSGILVGTGTGYVSLLFDGSSAWKSKGSIVPNGTANLGGLTNPWNTIYANSIFDNQNRVVTSVTPTSGLGIAITGLASGGPTVLFQVTNTGVLSIIAGTDTQITNATGNVTINVTATLATVAARGATSNNAIYINSSTAATNTSSGALRVEGGVGIGGRLYVRETIFSNGAQVWTTATLTDNSQIDNGAGYLTSSTIGLYGVSAINASTGIAVSSNTGSVTISNVGVVNLQGSTYIAVSTSTGSVQVINLGVQTLTAGTDTAVSRSTGTVTVWDISTLQSVTSRGNTTNQTMAITATNLSSNTSSGQALLVSGGVGALAVYASNVFDSGNRVLTGIVPVGGNSISITSVSTSNASTTFTINNTGVTTATGSTYLGVSGSNGNVTFTNLGVQTLTAGSGTAVSASTGQITISSTDTLQLVTNRGSTTSNIVYLTNATPTTSSNSGALQVTGGVGIGQSLFVGGDVTILGTVNAATVVGSISTATNLLGGTTGSIPYQLVSGQTRFIGIGPAGTLLQSNGSTATWNSTLTIHVGASQFAVTATNLIGGFVSATTGSFSGNVSINVGTVSTGTNNGALVVQGGLGVSGSLYAQQVFDGGTRVIKEVLVGPGLSVSNANGPSVTLTNTGVLSITGEPALGVSDSTGNISLTNLGVTSISTGSGIVVSGSTGSVNIASIDTLQLVTTRGASTDKALSVANTLTVDSLVIQNGFFGARNYIEVSQSVGVNSTANYWIKVIDFNLPNLGDSTQFKAKSVVRYFNNTTLSDNSDQDILWITLVKDTGTTLNGTAYWFNESSESAVSAGATNHTVTYNGSTGEVAVYRRATQANARAFVTILEQFASNATSGIQSVSPRVVTSSSWVSAVPTLGATLTIDDPDTLSQEDITVTGTLTAQGTISHSGNLAGFNNTTTGNTLNLSAGAITSGITKTINIGTSGLTGSTANINIGSNVANGQLIIDTTGTRITSTANAINTSTGALTVAGGVGIGRDLYVGEDAFILSPTNASSTNSGALQVSGGAGIGGNLYAGGLVYSQGSQVITAATLGAFGVSQIIAGTAISVSPTSGTGTVTITNLGVQQITTGSGISVTTSTGTVNIASIDTLQLVTDRGAATSNAIQITNSQPAISTSTGSLVVSGGIGVAQGMFVGGVSTFLGTITGTISTAQNLSSGVTGSIPYQSTGGSTTFLSIGASGFILQSNGTVPAWVSTSTLSVGFSDRSNTATNLSAGSSGQVPYQTGSGLTGFTGGPGLAGNILVSNGTAAPTFNSTLTLSAIIDATNTMSGTLQVRGGVGIGGTVYVGGDLWSRGSQVVTANNLGQFGVAQIVAGTAIGVSPTSGTGTVTITNLGVTSLTTSSLGGLAITTSTGTINIASIDTLQLVTQRGSSTNQPLSFTATNLSSSTSTGQALLVSGGIGALAVYARVLNDSGNRVITTITPAAGPGIGISGLTNNGPAASFNIVNLGVQTLTAGTDTAVSASTGTVTVWGISTLESVTSRGNSTTSVVFFNNTASATTSSNGSVVIAGGLGVAGDVYARNFYTNGQIIGASASSSTNLAGGLTGSIPYQSAPGLTGFINIGTAGTILTSNGTTATWQSPTALTAGNATTASNISGGLAGFIPIQTEAGRTSFIGSGTQNQLLMMGINTATWVTTTTIHVGQSVFSTTATNLANGVGGQIPYQLGAGQTAFTPLGIAGAILVSGGTGAPVFQSTLTLAETVQATSTATGSLIVGGGVGIGGNLWVGGTLYASIDGSISTATNLAGGTTGSIPIQSAAGQTKYINIGTNGQILQSNGTTATFVNTSTLVVGFADSTRGATNVSGGAAGSLVYQSAPSASAFVGIESVGSLLQVSVAGTPTWITTATITVGGAVTASTSTNLAGGVNGSIPYQNGVGRTTYIGIGPAGSILQSNGSTASWFTTATLLSGTSQNLNAGLGGQIPYQESSGVTRFIGTGTSGAILQMGSAGTATFVASGLITVGNATNATTSTRTQTVWGGTQGQLHYQSAANTTDFVNTGTEGMVLISRPTGPVFVNTLTLAGTTQATSTTTGALIVTGGAGFGGNVYVGGVLFATVAGSINTASNLAAGAAGALVYQSAAGTTAFLNIGVAGTILQSNGSIPQWQTTASILVGDALRAQSVNNLTGGAAGSIPIQSSAGQTAYIPIGGAGTLLQSNGSTATWVSTGSLVAGTAAKAVNIAGGLANQVPYQTAPDVTAFSANLTFNGSALTVGGAVTGATFIPTSASVPTNGLYLPAANTIGVSAGSANQINITTTGVGIKKTATVALDVAGQIQGDNIINTTNTTNATNTTNGAIRSGGGISAVNDVYAGGAITGLNGIRRTLGRVTTGATQPLAAPQGGGEEIFGIDETWTNAELRAFFNNNGVQWVADSTAPGAAIQVDGSISVGNNSYGAGFPYIGVESDDIFYMECWIRNEAGASNTHYMGSIDFDHNFSNLGGNPGTFGYFTMINTNPGTAWTKVSGYIGGFGNSSGQFRPGTKYWAPMALFNYTVSGTNRCYIAGWKVFRVNQNGNRTFPGVISVTNSSAAGAVGQGALRVSGGASISGQLWMGNSILGRVDSANVNGDANAPFRLSQDYSSWASHWAGTPGSNDGWGLFWAGNSGARYGTNGTGGPGNIWGNASNPNEAVFVGNGVTRWTMRLEDGQSWQQGNGFFGGDVYTSYSDVRLKDIKGAIENPLDKLREIETFFYEPNALAVSLGAQAGRKVGVSAQSVLKVLPEVTAPSPLNKEYLTVQYEKLVPLLIESIKELEKIVKDQQEQINKLKGQ